MESIKIRNGSGLANVWNHAKQRRWIHYPLVLGALIASFMAFTFGASGQATVFGPKTYTRAFGLPVTSQESFSVSSINSSFTLIIQNGDVSGERRVNSGTILLNGAQIVSDSDFNPRPGLIQKTVMLQQNNTLSIQLRSAVGSFITVIIARDPLPIVSITSPLNGTVFSAQPITVRGTIDTASAQVTVNGVPAIVKGGHVRSHATCAGRRDQRGRHCRGPSPV